MMEELGNWPIEQDDLKKDILLEAHDRATGRTGVGVQPVPPSDFTTPEPTDDQLQAAIKSILAERQIDSSWRGKRSFEILEPYLGRAPQGA